MTLRVTRILSREQALRLSFEVVAIVFASECLRENGQFGLIHSSTTGWPLKSASETVFPSTLWSENAGAVEPTAMSATAGPQAAKSRSPAAVAVAAETRAAKLRLRVVRFMNPPLERFVSTAKSCARAGRAEE